MARTKLDSEQLTDRNQSDVLITRSGKDTGVGSPPIVRSDCETRHEIRTDGAPATLFALLTNARGLIRWLARDVKADPQPGGIFRLTDFGGLWIEGTYLEVTPLRMVVFTWGGIEGLKIGQSTVEFILHPDGDSTLVQLRHFGLSEAAVDAHSLCWKNWGLPKLKRVGEAGDAGATCLTDFAEWREQNSCSAFAVCGD
jgi:uncharacterized protein YndB with AHSA1/START domain